MTNEQFDKLLKVMRGIAAREGILGGSSSHWAQLQEDIAELRKELVTEDNGNESTTGTG